MSTPGFGPADLPRNLPVPEQPAPSAADLDLLLAQCVERAGRSIEADGDFWPFALCLTVDGQLAEPQAGPDAARPEPEEVLVHLRGALRAGRDQLKAAAVCSDVTVGIRTEEQPEPQPTRALQVELQGRGGDPLLLVLPFTRPDGPRPLFSPPVGQRGQHPVWD